MLIDRKYEVVKVPPKQPGRYAMQHLHLNVERKTLTATDGRVLAIVPVQLDEHDATGLVPVDALKAAFKTPPANLRKQDQARVEANGCVVAHIEGGKLESVRPGGDFPRYEAVIDRDLFGASDTLKIGLNANLLFALAQALGAEDGAVTLYVKPRENHSNAWNGERQYIRPIGVKAHKSPDAVGCIMPITCG